jgi:hypothetical protein
MERKGASYSIKATRPANHHGEHTQVTQASARSANKGYADEKRRIESGLPPTQGFFEGEDDRMWGEGRKSIREQADMSKAMRD